jgi:hypothetical protein
MKTNLKNTVKKTAIQPGQAPTHAIQDNSPVPPGSEPNGTGQSP